MPPWNLELLEKDGWYAIMERVSGRFWRYKYREEVRARNIRSGLALDWLEKPGDARGGYQSDMKANFVGTIEEVIMYSGDRDKE